MNAGRRREPDPDREMGEAIRRRRDDRTRFLRRLYQLSEADVAAFQDGREIAAELALPDAEAARIIRYHEERGYLRHVGEGADLTVRITTGGIDFIESLDALD